MIAFLLCILGLVFHVLALFTAFGCGVEAERLRGKLSDDKAALYVLVCFAAFVIGLILIIASQKVS